MLSLVSLVLLTSLYDAGRLVHGVVVPPEMMYRSKHLYNLSLFLSVVVPLYCGCICIERVHSIVGIMVLVIILLIPGKNNQVPNTNSTKNSTSAKNSSSAKNNSYHLVLSHVRCKIVLLVSIAVFASDFSVWSHPFLGKSGLSTGLFLMDVGVGCFSVNAGLMYGVYSTNNTNTSRASYRLLVGACVSFLLGIVRLLCVIFADCYYDIFEYGRDMNYMMILGVQGVIMYVIQHRICTSNTLYNVLLVSGSVIILLYELSLILFLREYFDSLGRIRSGFWANNVEGVGLFISSMSTILITQDIGRSIAANNNRDNSGDNSGDKGNSNNSTSISTSNNISRLCLPFIIVVILFFISLYDVPYKRVNNMRYNMTIILLVIITGGISRMTDEVLTRISKVTINKVEDSTKVDVNSPKVEDSTKIDINSTRIDINSTNTSGDNILMIVSRSLLPILISGQFSILLVKHLGLRSIKHTEGIKESVIVHSIIITHMILVGYIVPLGYKRIRKVQKY